MRVLVVGCGSIGARHARNASWFAEVAAVEMVEERAEALRRDFGLRIFPSLEAGLEWSPDAAIVATPNTTHVELAAKLVSAGVAVLIEKPIADRVEGIDAMLDRAARSGSTVHVACNMRFHPGVVELRRNIQEIGTPYFARAQYGNYLPGMRPGADYRQLYCAQRELGGGVILDAIHEIDYLTWILGDVVTIRADAGKLSNLEIDVEDYASINLRHLGGVRSEIHLDYLQRFKRRGCELVGSDGTLLWQSEGKSPERCRVKLFRANSGDWETIYQSSSIDTNAPYLSMMQTFLRLVDGQVSSDLITGQQARRTLEIALIARKSAEVIK
jgi:predicted dehydrogenase